MGHRRAQTFIDALHDLEETRDTEPIVSLFNDDADISNPVMQHKHRGQDGARDFWSSYRGTFDEIHSNFRHVLEDGDTAVLEWTSRGRAADGGEIAYGGVSVLEFEGDRIRSFRTYFDSRALGMQLVDARGRNR
jgi:ketosteroid isomerase-like protein